MNSKDKESDKSLGFEVEQSQKWDKILSLFVSNIDRIRRAAGNMWHTYSRHTFLATQPEALLEEFGEEKWANFARTSSNPHFPTTNILGEIILGDYYSFSLETSIVFIDSFSSEVYVKKNQFDLVQMAARLFAALFIEASSSRPSLPSENEKERIFFACLSILDPEGDRDTSSRSHHHLRSRSSSSSAVETQMEIDVQKRIAQDPQLKGKLFQWHSELDSSSPVVTYTCDSVDVDMGLDPGTDRGESASARCDYSYCRRQLSRKCKNAIGPAKFPICKRCDLIFNTNKCEMYVSDQNADYNLFLGRTRPDFEDAPSQVCHRLKCLEPWSEQRGGFYLLKVVKGPENDTNVMFCSVCWLHRNNENVDNRTLFDCGS